MYHFFHQCSNFFEIDAEFITIFFQQMEQFRSVNQRNWFVLCEGISPSRESGGYILPIKAAVRKAEGLGAGDEVTVHLRY